MAKAKAPLQSFSAHGAIGKSFTYRLSNSENIVSGFSKPGDYRKTSVSSSQSAHRSVYSSAVSAWNSLTDEQKEVYNLRAVSLHLTGYNLYLREYLNNPPVLDNRLLETGDDRLLETGDFLLLE